MSDQDAVLILTALRELRNKMDARFDDNMLKLKKMSAQLDSMVGGMQSCG